MKTKIMRPHNSGIAGKYLLTAIAVLSLTAVIAAPPSAAVIAAPSSAAVIAAPSSAAVTRTEVRVPRARTYRHGSFQELELSRTANDRFESAAIDGKLIRRFASHLMQDVEVLQGTPKVVVEGYKADRAIPYMRFYIKNGTLTADTGDIPHNQPMPKVKIKVYLDEISSLTSYAGDISAGDITTPGLTLQTFGVGDINVTEATASSLKATSYGTGDINIGKCECTSMNLVSQGTGDINVSRAMFTTARLSSHGTGDISLTNFEGTQVNAVSHGTGDIILKGTASTADITVSGIGDVDTGGLKAPVITKTLLRNND